MDEVLAIHERLIEVFGGHGGVRDHGLLESALYRPQCGYYEDLTTMAAALFESLIMNHPFVDGNKRVAFFATDVFLRLNGWRLEVEAQPAYRLIIQLLDTGQCDLQHLRDWFQQTLVQSSVKT
jgi:death-on-curing protein